MRPFRFPGRKNFGVGYRSNERVFCQIFMVLRDNGFCFLQRREPPLNLQIFIAGDAFDNSAFFDEQLKFTGLLGSSLPFSLVAKSMRPVGTQSRFTTPLTHGFSHPLSLQSLSAD